MAAAAHGTPQACAEAALTTAMVTEKFTATEIAAKRLLKIVHSGELQ
jgi:hypothetical protein